ncbi:hypothetical protein SGLAM104S_08962 [Streptomyces glaucescens]
MPSKDGDPAAVPFTVRVAARAVVVPLAKRIRRVAVPAAGADAVNWTYAPVALVALQKPVPE